MRALVIGCPGGGKSTFARTLHQKTGVPLFHLDQLYWNADKTTVSDEILRKRILAEIAKDEWIADGNFLSTLELRLKRADTVFWLDLPTEVCLAGVEARRGKIRPDIPWVETEEDPEFTDFIKHFKETHNPVMEKLLAERKDLRVYRFSSHRESDGYLESLAAEGVPFCRQATEGDLDAVLNLYKRAVGLPGCTWNEYYPTVEEARTDLEGGNLFVSEKEGRVIASLSVVGKNELDGLPFLPKENRGGVHGELARLTVSPDERGHGYGGKLMEYVLNRLRDTGTDTVRLLVAKCNPAAQKTYQALEFATVSECSMYGNDYYLMEKELRG